jgi:hypothetical protein
MLRRNVHALAQITHSATIYSLLLTFNSLFLADCEIQTNSNHILYLSFGNMKFSVAILWLEGEKKVFQT